MPPPLKPFQNVPMTAEELQRLLRSRGCGKPAGVACPKCGRCEPCEPCDYFIGGCVLGIAPTRD